MEYPLMETPFEVKPFDEMTKKEAQQHFEWYIGQIEDRIRLLRSAYEVTGRGSFEDLDFSPESLKPLWKWFLERVEFVDKSPKKIREEQDRMPAWLRDTVRVSKKEPSRDTLILAMDIAIYFGEIFVRNFERISWGFVTRPKSLAYVNRPVLIGFKKTELDPRMVILNTLKKENPDALFALYEIWVKGIEA